MSGNRFIRDVQGVQVAQEITAGTFTTPTTALYLTKGASFPSPEFAKVTEDPMSMHSGAKYDIVVPDGAKINYELDQKMTADKSFYEPLLLASNFVGEPVAAPDGTAYTMRTNSDVCLSFAWVDARSTMHGKAGKGALSIKMEVGNPVELSFKTLVKYHDEVMLDAVAPDNSVPIATPNGFLYMRQNCEGYTINGVSAHFESVEIDWGATLVQPNTTCDAPNYVSEYAPVIKIKQSLTEEGEASFEELKLQSTKVIVIPLFDISNAKRAEIRIPNAVPSDLGKSGDEGRFKAEKTFACRPVVGDDNIELVIFD